MIDVETQHPQHGFTADDEAMDEAKGGADDKVKNEQPDFFFILVEATSTIPATKIEQPAQATIWLLRWDHPVKVHNHARLTAVGGEQGQLVNQATHGPRS